MAETKQEKSLIELVVELIDLFARYVRQQIKLAVDSGIAAPLKKAGFAAAVAILSAVIFGLAAIFITVGLFLLLIRIVGAAWIAFLIVGVVLLLVGAVIMRRGRKND